MNKFLLFTIALFAFTSCDFLTTKKAVAGPDEKKQMMDADRAFSKMSAEKGMKNAFMEYIDSNGVLLKPGLNPIIGADAIDYLSQMDDAAYKLEWQPKFGAVAKSGELGYTYGFYRLKPAGKDTVLFGTYVSIWKKQSDGSWKFVLDSGNEGVDEEE